MYECEIVDENYAGSASFSFSVNVDIKASPEEIFATFEDECSWPKWAVPITKVEWTSSKPFGLGTTRTVSMMGSLVGDEVFISWDYPKRMGFCFTHCSHSLIKTFAEDYRVEDLGDGLSRVTWTMGMTPQGLGKFSLALSRPFMGLSLQWLLNRFKRHVESSQS